MLYLFPVTDQPTAITVTPARDTSTSTLSIPTSQMVSTTRHGLEYLEQLSDFIIPGSQLRLIETLGEGNAEQVKVI